MLVATRGNNDGGGSVGDAVMLIMNVILVIMTIEIVVVMIMITIIKTKNIIVKYEKYMFF